MLIINPLAVCTTGSSSHYVHCNRSPFVTTHSCCWCKEFCDQVWPVQHKAPGVQASISTASANYLNVAMLTMACTLSLLLCISSDSSCALIGPQPTGCKELNSITYSAWCSDTCCWTPQCNMLCTFSLLCYTAWHAFCLWSHL